MLETMAVKFRRSTEHPKVAVKWRSILENCVYVSVAPRNVDRLCRPDLAVRDTRGYPRNCGDLLIGLNDGFSTDVVTGYDASYFHSHTVFLLWCRRLFHRFGLLSSSFFRGWFCLWLSPRHSSMCGAWRNCDQPGPSSQSKGGLELHPQKLRGPDDPIRWR